MRTFTTACVFGIASAVQQWGGMGRGMGQMGGFDPFAQSGFGFGGPSMGMGAGPSPLSGLGGMGSRKEPMGGSIP